MKRFIQNSIFGLFFVCFCAFSGNTQPIEFIIDEAVKTALKNNTSLINSQKAEQIYKERIREYYGSLYPSVNISASYARNLELPSFFMSGNKIQIGSDNSFHASLEAKQIIWAGGKVRTGINIAEIYSQLAVEHLRQRKLLIAKNVRILCYDILLASATVTIQREALETAKKHLCQIEERFKQGLASDLNVLRQQVEVSNKRPAVIKALNMEKLGLLNLGNLMGIDSEEQIALTESFETVLKKPKDIAELYQIALNKRAEISLVKFNYEMAQEKIILEKSGFYPNIYAFISREFTGQTNGTFPSANEYAWSSAAGLKLSVPIFSGGSTVSRIKQAELECQQAFEVLKETIRKVKIDVKKAWLDFSEARERVLAERGAIEQARKVNTATGIRFQNGLSSQLELNDSALALNKSQLLHITALHDAFTALAELKWAVGL